MSYKSHAIALEVIGFVVYGDGGHVMALDMVVFGR